MKWTWVCRLETWWLTAWWLETGLGLPISAWVCRSRPGLAVLDDLGLGHSWGISLLSSFFFLHSAQNHVNFGINAKKKKKMFVCLDWGEYELGLFVMCLWGFGGVWRLVSVWVLYGLCRERERVIEWDRPLVKVEESLRLWPVGVGWDRWERVNWKLWWVCVFCNFYNLQLYIISAISAISCKFSAICVLYMILNGISCSIELGFVCWGSMYWVFDILNWGCFLKIMELYLWFRVLASKWAWSYKMIGWLYLVMRLLHWWVVWIAHFM